MSQLVFQHDRAGYTGPLRATVRSEASHGALGAAGLGPASYPQEWELEANGNLPSTAQIAGVAPGGGPMPPLHRLTVYQGARPISSVTFYPIETAPGIVSVLSLLRAGQAQVAAPEQLAALSTMLDDGTAKLQEMDQALADTAQQQAANDQSTAQAISLMQAEAGVYNLGRMPHVGDPAGAYTFNGVRYEWDGAAVTGQRDLIVSTEALKRISVDATLYGVAEGASAQTFLDAVAATPDGGTLVCPRVKLKDHGGRLLIQNRRNLTIEGNGLVIEADSDLPDPSTGANGGIYFLYCEQVDVYDVAYDGRLDARTPYGSDAGDTNMKSAWNILTGCVGVRLHNCAGLRGMMDGFYVGHRDNTFGVLPDIIQANMPWDTELNNCRAEYNYRQGLSVVGCNGLTVRGGEYSYTGMLGPDKGTLPMAGIDTEAFSPLGWLNLRVHITGNPNIHHNKGVGVLVENATWGLLMDSGHIHHNAGSAVGFSSNDTKDNVITGVLCEFNCTDTPETVEVVIRGLRQTFNGNRVNCSAGVRGIAGSTPGAWNSICDNTVTGQGDGTLSTGGIASVGENARVTGNLCIEAVVTLAGYGAVHVEGVGSTATGNRAITYLSGNPTAYGVRVVAGVAYAAGNSSMGYAGGVVSDAPGSPLNPPSPPALAFVDGLAMDGYGTLDTQTASVVSSDPDVLVYRLEAPGLHWDTQGATPGGAAFFRVDAPAGYSPTIRRVQAYDPNTVKMGQAFLRPGVPSHVGLIVPDEAFYGMGLMLEVELRRE